MIRHIVMWQVRGDTAQEKRISSDRVKEAFEGLRGRIPGMRHLEIGIDSSTVDYACDVVLVSDFESREALEAYANHPEHLRVRQQLGDVRTARHQVDYEVSQPITSSLVSSVSPAAEASDANA
ncbi:MULTISPECIES: Dabb family protein [Paraburkholderia]|uniref:Dabb family protein n=1 Tax=Paraburkholderia TaxID=1822464 RepID=UPI00224C8929|nr:MULTISPECIES: Dabb family protein [Paraburkholderia]MCX4161861.1 Dabb family protein [Paraburkholderia megapolitana]MDN7157358.1 Dabb family protein [Paraburkholderia sp. CHISQ3]MDQ6494403.1 Dabb family protein [Paraburkholderia megapolitana]